MTSMFICTLEQHKLKEEYMGSYTNGQMIMDPIYGQISYNCCLSKAFKLKLKHNPKIFLVKIKRPTEKEFAKYVIEPTNVIPTTRVQAQCVQLLTFIHTLRKVLQRVDDGWKRMMVGKRMILVLM